MMKNLTLTAVLSLFALSPVHAQDAVDAAEDAMEHVVEASEAAASDTTRILVEGESSPPHLLGFDLLQLKPTDYPPLSWVNGEEGTARYELAVDAEGAVTDCTIIESTGHEALDAKTCEIAFERGKFTPAIDESGSLVAGVHRDFQVWTKREPQFQGPSTIHVQFTVTTEGNVVNCETIEVSGEIGERMRSTLENEPCPGMNRTNRAPYRDELGNPISKRVDLLVVVKSEDIEQ